MLRSLLLPHVFAVVLFLGAFGWMDAVGHNRSAMDFWLATAGYIFGVGAVITTSVAVVLVLAKSAHRARWPWLLVHGLALAWVVWLGHNWLGAHIA